MRKATAAVPLCIYRGTEKRFPQPDRRSLRTVRNLVVVEHRLDLILRNQIGKPLEVFGNPSGVFKYLIAILWDFMFGTATEIMVVIL